MRLVIQIPCLNEEITLPATLRDLPRSLPGIDEIQVLVIDDGSNDRTSSVARAHKVDRVVRFPHRRGLAQAFYRGLHEALAMGADVIVNTDADNQYRGDDIGRLVAPIVAGRADIVIGARNFEEIKEFSALKKRLQRLGSWVVRRLSETSVPDTTSGFRAYSREAGMRITVLSDFTYTLETIIQASRKNIAIEHVDIHTNSSARESRLFGSMFGYIKRSLGTMLRIYVLYRPLRFFLALSGLVFALSLALIGRFFYYYVIMSRPTGHVQSLVIGAGLAVIAFLVAALAVLSDLIAMNRYLLEEILTMVRRVAWEGDHRAKTEAPDDLSKVR